MDLEYLTLDEVAEKVRVPPRYLEAVIRRGEGPPVTRLSERKSRVRSDLLEQWLQDRTVQRPAAPVVEVAA